MNPFFIGLPAFAVCLFVGYLLREWSVGKLEADQLGSLDKALRPYRIRYVISMAGLLVLFIAFRYGLPRFATAWFETGLLLFAVTTVGFEMVGWRTSALRQLSRSFRVPYLISRVVSISGMLCLLAAMAATPFFDVGTHR